MREVTLCPKCKSDRLVRSHRKRWFEHLISEFGVFPYRCGKCGFRFSRFDFLALWVEHLEKRAWFSFRRVFYVTLLTLGAAFVVYYFRSAR